MFKFFKGLLLLSLCFSMTQAQCGTGCLTCEGAVCSDCLNKYYLSGGNCRMTSFMLNFDSPFKSDNCHESCLNCFGPDEDQCLDCLPPRKLHSTYCNNTIRFSFHIIAPDLLTRLPRELFDLLWS